MQVWLDVTDIIDYNMSILNRHSLSSSFFQVAKDDPTVGFEFDATTMAGYPYPKTKREDRDKLVTAHDLSLRLALGSHLAMYIRHELEQQKGYTSTVGIATNKLISKLIGNVNKPKGQTTLMPDPETGSLDESITSFMDAHEIGKVPGIGFKLGQRLREFVLQKPVQYTLWGDGHMDQVKVADVRTHPEIDYEKLEKLLAGPGSAHGIGYKVWCLLHGNDESEVSQARAVPRQISIEDSYVRLDTMPELLKELKALSCSLINRMRIDLLANEDDAEEGLDQTRVDSPLHAPSLSTMKWLAHPRTLRLSTRPRQPLQSDGTRHRTMKRTSHSCPLPNFVFLLNETVDVLAEKLVKETLITMFRKLHPEKTWWNLSLVNLAVTNMAEAASDSKTASGRDIGNMFKRQEDILKHFRVTEVDNPIEASEDVSDGEGSRDAVLLTADEKIFPRSEHEEEVEEGEGWVDEDSTNGATDFCPTCGSTMPSFAMAAHLRFHTPQIEPS